MMVRMTMMINMRVMIVSTDMIEMIVMMMMNGVSLGTA